MREGAAYAGMMSDGGASGIDAEATLLEEKWKHLMMGAQGFLPNWVKPLFDEYEKVNSDEYKHYLELKKKFESD